MVSFSPAAFEAFAHDEDASPVVMLNLIRLQPHGGREGYREYLRLAEPILARHGAKILFSGDGLPVLSAGEAAGCDVVTLVQYPGRSAFLRMIEDAEYKLVFNVGASAIADIILQPLKSFAALPLRA